MDLQKFSKGFPKILSKSQLDTNFQDLQSLLEQISGKQPTDTMLLLNFAVSCMAETEVYCQVNSEHLEDLIAALVNHENVMSYIVNNVENSDIEEFELQSTQILSDYHLDDQVCICSQDYKTFFADLEAIGSEDKIGVFFCKELTNNYETFAVLELAKKFLAERALIILESDRLEFIHQATEDFINSHSECQSLVEINDELSQKSLKILTWQSISVNYQTESTSSNLQISERKNMGNIYMFCPDINVPVGGIKQIYRHVDILNKNGFSASIVHTQPNFRCTWFANTTKISYFGNFQLTELDYLVLTEGGNTLQIDNIELGIKKVIFNQNAYCTFANYPIEPSILPISYLHPDVIATITASEDGKNYLSYVFPNLNIFRVHYGFDHTLFRYTSDKKKQICFMTRKHLEDAIQVFNILKYRNALSNFQIVPITDKTEAETAQIFRDSLIFLSFGYPEGFQMPSAEAMACGCVVVGYHGMGAKEFFKPEFSYPIDAGYIIQFASAIEEVIKLYNQNPELILAKGKQASEYVLNEYSISREERDILEIWQQIFQT